MFSSFDKNTADNAVARLLDSLGMSGNSGAISEELLKHPDYPSLLAVSDVLTSKQIENDAFRVEYDELVDIPGPFLAHTYQNNGELVVVSKVTDDKVFISGEGWRRRKLSAEKFKTIFSGVVLVVEPAEITEKPGNNSFSSFLTSVRQPAIALGLVLLLISALVFNAGYLSGMSWQTATLTLVKTAGLLTSILLLVQSMDTNNPMIQKLCQNQGSQNCTAILSSKAAKVFEGLSWSEVGFFYFAGTWLLLLFGGNSPAMWQVLAVLNLLSLPYTFYSIYYQARVAKQWCVLCCTIQALLWLEFFTLGAYLYTSTQLIGIGWNAPIISTSLICLLSPVLFWVMLKPLLLKTQQVLPLKEQLQKFKYNAELFNALLAGQPQYPQPGEDWSIVLGNVEAGNIITMATNPYCQPCAIMHKALEELMEHNDNIQLRIIFTTENNDEDERTQIGRHFMALNALPDKTIIEKALHDWYEQKQKNYDAWAKIYPATITDGEVNKLEKQKIWFHSAEVTGTPTIFLNGHRLPKLYHPSDLKYMLS